MSRYKSSKEPRSTYSYILPTYKSVFLSRNKMESWFFSWSILVQADLK